MVHNLTTLILGELPDYALWIYSVFDLLLAVVICIICLSPFILIIKMLGGR